MQTHKLNNGYNLPVMCVGTNRMDLSKLVPILNGALDAGISFFDSARDYGNEPQVGEALQTVLSERGFKREDVCITTKVGNGQQTSNDMYHEIELSLRNLRTEYVDLWMLHWPLPGYYIENMRQMVEIMKSGKVKAIGLANPRVRHLKKLYDETGITPQVIQIEHHPFRLSKDILTYCEDHKIQVEAYSPLCFMIGKLRENPVLIEIAKKYGKSLGQIVLRWHYQHHIIPVFRSEKPTRFKENVGIFDFELSQDDMNMIFALDEDYKFIPESLHCLGY